MSELSQKIAEFFKILSDGTRLDILDFLKDGDKTSEQIQNELNKSQSTISQQLKTLTDSELITSEKKGIMNYYSIKYDYVFKILNFVKSFVITLQKEKVRRFSELDIRDTLF